MSSESQEQDWAEKIGAPAYDSIREMVDALNCDYERLTELREEFKDLEKAVKDAKSELDTANGDEINDLAKAWERCSLELAEWTENNREVLEELAEAAGDCEDQDQARERIEEDALSVEVRSDWETPGSPMTPAEYRLLLSTGGPAVRIIGDLTEHNEPRSARLEVQDWFKPWTEYVPASQDVLLEYARCFYYGD